MRGIGGVQPICITCSARASAHGWKKHRRVSCVDAACVSQASKEDRSTIVFKIQCFKSFVKCLAIALSH